MSSFQVAILSGSTSDSVHVDACAEVLDRMGVGYERHVISAHRQPAALHEYVRDAENRGCQIFVAMAGMAAHLPGVVASLTARPVLGVPLPGGVLDGVDALLAVVQMPGGVPVATFAVGKAGARNAAHMAVRMLGLAQPEMAQRVDAERQRLAEGGR